MASKRPPPALSTNKPGRALPGSAPVPRSVSTPALPRVVLPGSERAPLPAGDLQGTVAPPRRSGRTPLTVSVLVRRRQSISNTQPGAEGRMSRAAFRAQHSADPVAVKAVKVFARQFGLSVQASPAELDARTLKLSGTAAQLETAFGVSLAAHAQDGATYRVREGAIYLPVTLDGLVEAVLGLDNRPQAAPHFRVAYAVSARDLPAGATPAANGSSFTPPQIAQLYQFPSPASAAGQTIGLIELGGGFRPADIKAYFKTLGLVAPSVVAVPVDGGKNAPSTASGADGEVMLDIEVAGAVAPGANIAVYFAPNTDQGFIDAIATAVHDSVNKPSVISISWGGPESSWTQQAITALDSACQAAALLGVTITAASGDNGSTDGVSDGKSHVDFPASSPHVLACGGTRITASGTTLTDEVVWNELAANEGATGGGVSAVFSLPPWQASANVPAAKDRKKKAPAAAGGRGVPDVAGNADPVTGYSIRVDGQTLAIGGTSAVAPLWAGLIALANAKNKQSAGFINPTLYANPAAFRDITKGDNGAFKAAKGWDPCTGLGSPIGAAVILLLGSATGSAPTPGRRKKAHT